MALAGVAVATDVGYTKHPDYDDYTFTGNPTADPITLSSVGAAWSSTNGSIYWGGTNSSINLTVDNDYAAYRITTASGATVNSLTLNFDGKYTLTSAGEKFGFSNVSNLTINFGDGGKISSNVIDLGSDDLNLNFTTTTDVSSLAVGLYARDLFVASNTIYYSDNYLKNTEGHGTVSFSDSTLDAAGYTYKGFINADNIDSLAAGEYALALVGTQKYQLVANIIPEPTTATLSMLALAGLAARRRRR